MNFFKKCPFVTIILILSLGLFIYGMLLYTRVVKASNSVNLNGDLQTVGVATGVQDLKIRLQNFVEGINERDYSVDYMPTEYVPDDEIIKNFGVEEETKKEPEEKKGEKSDSEKALDEEAEARRAERSERMRNGEADEVIRETMKNVLPENDLSTPGDTYDGFYNVNESYFNGGDTVVIGDSREQGFGLFSGLNVINYAQKSYGVHQVFTKKWIETEIGKLTLEEAMAATRGNFKKIYIMFGLNEMGWADETTFDNAYYQLIDMLKYYQPDAVIYVQSIINVTKSKNDSSPVFNNTNINARNEALRKVAENEHVAYLDLNSAMADENGNLPEEFAADGIHIKQGYMNIWVDFLKSHAVISGEKDMEYLTGEGTYKPSEPSNEEPDEDNGDTEDENEEEPEETPAPQDEAKEPSAEPAPAPAPAPAPSNDGTQKKSPVGWETGDDIN